MPTLNVIDVLRVNGFLPMSEPCGLTKNMRKRRNRKIKHAAAAGGPGGLTSLFTSSDFNTYIDPTRLKKLVQKKVVSTLTSSLPGLNQDLLALSGGWGRLPNVSAINYADDDPRGWVPVTRSRRNRLCRIQDEEYYEGE